MPSLAEFALVAGVAAAVAPFAQARRILRRRSSQDVSLCWLWLYGAGCSVWIAYGLSIGSAPLVASQSVAGVGSVTATILALRFRRFDRDRWWASLPPLRRPYETTTPTSSPPRLVDVMLPVPVAVLDELVVEEASRRFFGGSAGGEPSALPVVDRRGHAVGILTRSDIAALRPADRISRLVAELARRDPAVIAWTGLDAGRVLARRAVARAGFALVTDRRGRLVGVAWSASVNGAQDRSATDSASEPLGHHTAGRGRSRGRGAKRRANSERSRRAR